MTIKIQLDTHALKALFETEEAQVILRKSVVDHLVSDHIGRFLPAELRKQFEAIPGDVANAVLESKRKFQSVIDAEVVKAIGLGKTWNGEYVPTPALATKINAAATAHVTEVVVAAVQTALIAQMDANTEAKIVERAAQILANDKTRRMQEKLAKYEALAKEG